MMEIKTLQHDDFFENITALKDLLISSYETNFNISRELCSVTVDSKIQELGQYVKLEKATLFGAFNEGVMVGFVWCYVHDYFGENRLHVNQIVIGKKYRGQGIAKELLNHTEKYATELNIKTIDLFVTEGNITAVKMYEDLGYVTERRYLKKSI
ncbi:Ribosomal protein S18 acetylase RimI [Acidaminobacter hydrogenoformans DSM 2784]|uniref:Ribosomal protein S18 acetylase RimI n=2 Tax=Acidaminobacter TaxID=65402 RepID=A0A1G5S4R2_9FIRM|nr:Ribosomal protein S18 acetylase RimI [Acidaminobacter hydrogenoformans DSM 2784]